MRTNKITGYKDMCSVCGQTPCNCTHINKKLVEFVTPQAVAGDPGLEREKDVDVIFYGQPGRDWKAEDGWAALEEVLPREYPAGDGDDGHSLKAQLKVQEVGRQGGAVVTNKPLSVAKKLVSTFNTYGIKSRINEGVAEGAEERKRNALWAQITSYEQRAKATKNDIKKQHLLKMADELRGKLPPTDEEKLEEALTALTNAIQEATAPAQPATTTTPAATAPAAPAQPAATAAAPAPAPQPAADPVQQKADQTQQKLLDKMGARFGLPPGSSMEQVQAAQQAYLDKNDPAAAAQYKQNMTNIDAGNTAANKPVELAPTQPATAAAQPAAQQDPNFAAGLAAQKAGGSPVDIMLAQPDIANNQKLVDAIGSAYGLPAGSTVEQIKAAAKGQTAPAQPAAAQPAAPAVAEGKAKKAERPEADYGDDYQDMVSRVKKLAGLGPLKTVYDPQKRVYKNVPQAVQPKK